MIVYKKQKLAAFALLVLITLTPSAVARATTPAKSSANSGSGSGSAATPPPSQQVATRTYTVKKFIQYGSIVTLDDTDPSKIAPASDTTLTKMLGVVVSPSESPISLTDGMATDKAYVATSGRYGVLVSTQNGDIKIGDYLTVSAVDGVGMKTGTSQGLVLGTAATPFNGKQNALTKVDLKDAKGITHSVSIGIVQADINIGQNPFLFRLTGGVPKTLNVVTSAITGKPVSAIRIYLGLAVLMMVLFVVASLTVSGIRGAFAAIGRNPLARKSIMRGMIQVVTTALIIFTFGLLGVYLILKL